MDPVRPAIDVFSAGGLAGELQAASRPAQDERSSKERAEREQTVDEIMCIGLNSLKTEIGSMMGGFCGQYLGRTSLLPRRPK